MFGLGDSKKAFDDMCYAVRDRSTFIADEFRNQANEANETLHQTKRIIEDTANDIKKKSDWIVALEGVKTCAALVCAGLIGYIAYKVSD